MPYKDKEYAKLRAKARYLEKKGLPVPEGLPRVVFKTPEERRIARRLYIREYEKRPGVLERKQNNELKRLYGITLDDKKALYEKQKGVCPICLKSLPEVAKAHLDHCHKTGKVRGVLHKICNTMVAYEENNEGILNRAMSYLQNGR